VSQFEDAALLLSALPIVGLTVLSKTDFGTRLEGAIVDRRPALDAAEAAAEVQRAVARAASPHYGAGRSKFLGPLAFDSAYPPHLVGELPGDYGFDPLNLSASPESLDRNQELELLHARWAMLGVVGVVVPELLTEVGALPLAESVWWKVGAAKLGGESLNYLGVGGFVIAGKQGVAVIAACQAWKCDQGGGGRGAALVTRPCHSTLSLDLVTRPCHSSLSLDLVTRPCHSTLSLDLVTRPCHSTLSLDLVTYILHSCAWYSSAPLGSRLLGT